MEKVTIYFHAAGVVSEEEHKIVELTDTEVSLDDGNDETRKFNRKNGKCLNDSNYFGAYRTIKPF